MAPEVAHEYDPQWSTTPTHPWITLSDKHTSTNGRNTSKCAKLLFPLTKFNRLRRCKAEAIKGLSDASSLTTSTNRSRDENLALVLMAK